MILYYYGECHEKGMPQVADTLPPGRTSHSPGGFLLGTSINEKGSPIFKAEEAIQNFWQGAMDMGIRSAKLETIEVEGHGDTAIDEGKYTLRGESGNILDRGKYIVIWKQQAGQWKFHWDIWTSSLSPQGD